jgi:chromosome segregation ATPase
MESEKVKEIKKCLEMFAIDNKEMTLFQSPVPQGESCVKTIKYADILTLINELESENENFKGFMERNDWESIEDMETTLDKAQEKCFEVAKEKQQLKDRIAELEKENDCLTEECQNLNGRLMNITRETAPTEWKLKQFAERLKEKCDYMDSYDYGRKGVFITDIDETLKEFIDD